MELEVLREFLEVVEPDGLVSMHLDTLSLGNLQLLLRGELLEGVKQLIFYISRRVLGSAWFGLFCCRCLSVRWNWRKCRLLFAVGTGLCSQWLFCSIFIGLIILRLVGL